MADRLNRITTRTGDRGTTGLADGSRVPKTHARIDALGDVDELNSALGLVLAHSGGTLVAAILVQVQHRPFALGAEIAVPGSVKVTDEDVAAIDAAVEQLNASLPPLREFLYRNQPVVDVIGKGEKHRRVALNRDVVEAILDYQKALLPLTPSEGGQYLFYTLGEHGNCDVRPLTHKAVNCLLRRVRKVALITKRITPHTTRQPLLPRFWIRGLT